MVTEFFENRVIPLSKKLYRYAYSFLLSKPEAEDVVQEVLVKGWIQGPRLMEIKNLEAWLMSVTKNMVIDKFRKRNREKIYSMDGVDLKESSNMEKEMIDRNTWQHMVKMISRLSAKQQQVIYLRDIEGHSYREIGNIMGIDENLVKITLFRARENLRIMIRKLDNYGL